MNLLRIHVFLYNVFLFVYKAAIHLTRRWNPKAKKWVDGRKGLFQKVAESRTGGGPVLWMHCASLGEFEQGRPVLEKFRKNHPEYKVVLTFFSPSGYEVQKGYAGADDVFYLPFGGYEIATKFIRLINPRIVFWIKYDYWYHYLKALKDQGIPVFLISAIFRPKQPFFQWYGLLHRTMLGFYSQIFVQTDDSMRLLANIGLTGNVTVTGDTRFDRVIEIAESASQLPVVQKFCGDLPVIVAGSTWREDEEELDHFANNNLSTRFILAPHEIDHHRLEEIEKLFQHTLRYSRLAKSLESTTAVVNVDIDPNTLIVDNIGMLSTLYKYATICYVGGGFGREGVHNVLEAAVYGKPVIYGPEFSKYNEAVGLIDCGGAFAIRNALELEKLLSQLLSEKAMYEKASEAAKNFVMKNRGASEKILRIIENKMVEIR